MHRESVLPVMTITVADASLAMVAVEAATVRMISLLAAATRIVLLARVVMVVPTTSGTTIALKVLKVAREDVKTGEDH